MTLMSWAVGYEPAEDFNNEFVTDLSALR
jgi:hypothetical protein